MHHHQIIGMEKSFGTHNFAYVDHLIELLSLYLTIPTIQYFIGYEHICLAESIHKAYIYFYYRSIKSCYLYNHKKKTICNFFKRKFY